jgi:hypothetical protein
MPRVARADDVHAAATAHVDDAQPAPRHVDTQPPEDTPDGDAPDDDCSRCRCRRWYGWQTLSTDGAALVTFALIGPTNTPGLGLLGLAFYGLGGPVVHALHGNFGAAVGSLALRDVVPPLLFLTGFALFHRSDAQSSGEINVSGFGEGLIFFGAGALTAVVLDAAVSSFERAPSPARAKDPPDTASRWWPSVQPVRSGAMGGIGGVF